jgi:hypothetical protein
VGLGHWHNAAAAIPVLIDWLGRIDPEQARLREGMVRAQTTRTARPAAVATIAAEMKRQAEHGADWTTLWAYGNALARRTTHRSEPSSPWSMTPPVGAEGRRQRSGRQG